MQAQTSIRVPDACTTPPHVCLLSEASGYRSISTGKERDTESGNDYFEARYYSSAMGRFMSPDWSAKAEPVPYAKLDDPQTLNLYGYVRNNPLTHADADGHCYPLCTMAIGAAVGFVAGAGAEYIGEKLKGEKVDSSKIWHAGAGGALAGAITGLAGPEAGLAVKLGTSVGGQVIGGAVERKLNGEKVLDLKAGAKDAAAGLLGTKIDGAAEKTFASTFLKKAVPAATEAVIDAGQRGSGSEAKPAPPRPQPQPQTQHN